MAIFSCDPAIALWIYTPQGTESMISGNIYAPMFIAALLAPNMEESKYMLVNDSKNINVVYTYNGIKRP